MTTKEVQAVDEDEKVKMVCEVNNVYATSRARDTLAQLSI